MTDERTALLGPDIDSDPRRRLLLRGLAAGWLVGGTGWVGGVHADVFGAVPRKLPAGKSIFEIDGDVRINGKRARRDTLIVPGDVIETGSDGRLVGVIACTGLAQGVLYNSWVLYATFKFGCARKLRS